MVDAVARGSSPSRSQETLLLVITDRRRADLSLLGQLANADFDRHERSVHLQVSFKVKLPGKRRCRVAKSHPSSLGRHSWVVGRQMPSEFAGPALRVAEDAVDESRA